MLSLEVPAPLAGRLLAGQASEHPHEGDDPGNDWVFGIHAELFQQELVGKLDTPSGYVAVAADEAADAAAPNRTEAWERVQAALARSAGISASDSGPGKDVRAMGAAWVGRVLNASTAGVYVSPKRRAGEATGVMIQSIITEHDE